MSGRASNSPTHLYDMKSGNTAVIGGYIRIESIQFAMPLLPLNLNLARPNAAEDPRTTQTIELAEAPQNYSKFDDERKPFLAPLPFCKKSFFHRFYPSFG